MLMRILYYYCKTLFLKNYLNTPEKLANHQCQQWNKLVQKTLVRSPFYKNYLHKPFQEWPIINKKIMMEHFDEINTVHLKKELALAVALRAEQTRDFSPLINRIAVGLSSGTSGSRGLFLASPQERDAWTGIILAKLLPNGIRTPERIALFLRANNTLYTTINKSKKIQFHFFDLLHDFAEHIQALNQLQPTILAAPSSVLRLLALHKNQLFINPHRIIAVAEVLDPTDETLISQAFKQPVSQIYQCTEGFLAASDNISNHLVLNEEFLIIEKEWQDKNRFIPIITDLMRTTQPIIRYRLDDVLVVRDSNGVFTELSAIEGRLGDLCYGKKNHEFVPLFADLLRQAMASSPVSFNDYLICQQSSLEFNIQITPELENKEVLIMHLNSLFIQKGCDIPNWNWQPYEKQALDAKQRRIQSKFDPYMTRAGVSL
jgi:putative adenylate-forming enzyme